ncbi:hypothetical protein HNP00_004465 [Arthrobacter sp. AZCC_0090]|nr:hypothetical protein [Arthrobacter sp. AZCC_0090]
MRPLRGFPVAVARRLHFAVMVFFVAFIVVHVTLAFATGAIANFNHMWAVRDDQSWWGFAILAGSIVVIAAAWVGLRPDTLRWLASLGRKISRRPRDPANCTPAKTATRRIPHTTDRLRYEGCSHR